MNNERSWRMISILIWAIKQTDFFYDPVTARTRADTHTHTHTHARAPLHHGWTRIFSHTLLERTEHQYLNGQHLACKMRTGMYEVLTKSGLSFIYKIIQGIISMLRAKLGHPIILGPILRFSKYDESETEAKTNSGH